MDEMTGSLTEITEEILKREQAISFLERHINIPTNTPTNTGENIAYLQTRLKEEVTGYQSLLSYVTERNNSKRISF